MSLTSHLDHLTSHLSRLDVLLGPSGRPLVPSWPIWGPPGVILGRPEGPKQCKNQWFFNHFTFATFRISGPTLDLTWAILDLAWAILAPSWAPLGVSWASVGVLRAPLGGLWEVQGPLLESS